METALVTNPETSNFWFTLRKTVKEQLFHISETYFTKPCTVKCILQGGMPCHKNAQQNNLGHSYEGCEDFDV